MSEALREALRSKRRKAPRGLSPQSSSRANVRPLKKNKRGKKPLQIMASITEQITEQFTEQIMASITEQAAGGASSGQSSPVLATQHGGEEADVWRTALLSSTKPKEASRGRSRSGGDPRRNRVHFASHVDEDKATFTYRTKKKAADAPAAVAQPETLGKKLAGSRKSKKKVAPTKRIALRDVSNSPSPSPSSPRKPRPKPKLSARAAKLMGHTNQDLDVFNPPSSPEFSTNYPSSPLVAPSPPQPEPTPPRRKPKAQLKAKKPSASSSSSSSSSMAQGGVEVQAAPKPSPKSIVRKKKASNAPVTKPKPKPKPKLQRKAASKKKKSPAADIATTAATRKRKAAPAASKKGQPAIKKRKSASSVSSSSSLASLGVSGTHADITARLRSSSEEEANTPSSLMRLHPKRNLSMDHDAAALYQFDSDSTESDHDLQAHYIGPAPPKSSLGKLRAPLGMDISDDEDDAFSD
jgi:hypothetical protein